MDQRKLVRLICCPSGRCISPENCYADDRSRQYPTDFHAAAEAILREMSEEQNAP